MIELHWGYAELDVLQSKIEAIPDNTEQPKRACQYIKDNGEICGTYLAYYQPLKEKYCTLHQRPKMPTMHELFEDKKGNTLRRIDLKPEQVYRELKADPDIVLMKIADKFNCSSQTIHVRVEALKKAGLISRTSSNGYGRWIIHTENEHKLKELKLFKKRGTPRIYAEVSEEAVLKAIKLCPESSYVALARKFNTTPNTIENRIKNLKAMKLIKRSGTKIKGYWKVREA